eukprot:m.218407 g.218407  ORF g.218407 m.218407 type:complete len:102 (+) comp13816_c0_seq1:298-603(+)
MNQQPQPPPYSQTPQYHPQAQTQVVVTVQPSAREQERNARRVREQQRTNMMLGLLCGGFLCCICVGPQRAGVRALFIFFFLEMGKNVADTLLCMGTDCGGF